MQLQGVVFCNDGGASHGKGFGDLGFGRGLLQVWMNWEDGFFLTR